MVYGYYYKSIKKGPVLHNDICPGCGSKGTLHLDVICKVNHCMYVPCWPSDKQVVLECLVCNGKFRTEAIPHIHPEGMHLQRKTPYRFYHFTGLFLALVLIGLFAYLKISSDKEILEKLHDKIETLDEGLVINYKLPDKQKTSMYVDSVKGDSVWVRENRMATTGQLMKINKTENYSDQQTIYLKEELHKLANEDRIIDIYITSAYVRKQIQEENENIQD